MNNQLKAIENRTDEQKPVNMPASSRNVVIWGLVFIGLFFGGLGGWAAVAQLQGAVIANGQIIVESYRKQVQHLDGGIVEQILVREGDKVEKKDVLIRLNGENVRAQRDLYRSQMDDRMATQARLMAEIDGSDSIDWPPSLLERKDSMDVKNIIESEGRIFKARLEAKISRINLLKSRITRQQSVIEGNKKQLESVRNIIASLEKELAAKKPLLKEKYLDLPQILQLQRTLDSNHAHHTRLESQIEQARDAIKELELEIEDLKKRYRQEAAAELGKVRTVISQLREQLRPLEDAARRLEITAPESGTVVNLNVRTEGGVIRGGEPLMEIVPSDSSLIISARVDPSKIDEVRKNQLASVSLSAFPMRYTPKVDGVVKYVSADRIEPTQQGMPPYYLVYIELERESLVNAIGDISRLTPGMPADVYIQTDKRTVLSYMLTPITESMDRAFRE